MSYYFRLRKVDLWTVAYKIQRIIPELKNVNSEHIRSHLAGWDINFYEKEKRSVKWYVRLTLPFAFIVFVLLFIFLPVAFMFTGKWGYNSEKIRNWFNALGLKG